MLLIIAREYRLAAVEDCDCNGWWQVRQEVRYLPRCPKRKRIMNLKGFFIPRFGNLLEPVTGYFWRRLIRRVYATEDRDPRLYAWFRKTFGPDDCLRSLCALQRDPRVWERERRGRAAVSQRPTGLPEEDAARGECVGLTGVAETTTPSPPQDRPLNLSPQILTGTPFGVQTTFAKVNDQDSD